MCQSLRRQCLARATRTREEGTDAQTTRSPGTDSPGFVHDGTSPYMRRNLPQDLLLRLRQYQVIPIGCWLNALRQVIQPWTSLYAAGIPQQRAELILRYLEQAVTGARKVKYLSTGSTNG